MSSIVLAFKHYSFERVGHIYQKLCCLPFLGRYLHSLAQEIYSVSGPSPNLTINTGVGCGMGDGARERRMGQLSNNH